MANYTLAIQSRPLPAIIEGDRITLAPTHTVKLEAQRSTVVRTGVKIGTCKQDGYLLITPFKDYADDLDFQDNIYEFDYLQELVIVVINKGYQFLRIDEKENHLFTFEWISNDVAIAIDPAAVAAIEAAVESAVEAIAAVSVAVEDAIEEVYETPVETPVEAPVVAPVAPVAPVVAPVVEPVVAPVAPVAPVVAPVVEPVVEPVAPVVEPVAIAASKPRIIRRRVIQKKRV